MLSNHMHRVQLGGGGKNSYSLSIVKIDATSRQILNLINIATRCLEDISYLGVDIFWPHHLPSRFLV